VGDLDELQQPVWSPDSKRVFVTRTRLAGAGATAEVTVLSVPAAGGLETPVMTLPGVAGAYPIGFDPDGRLLVVAIDASGSTLHRQQADPVHLSPHITRDWSVSPGGDKVAFIEADLAEGLRYRLAVISLSGQQTVSAQAITADGQQLGVAWHPAESAPTAGQEPGSGDTLAASAGSPGFDIPLAYSPDGAFLAVEAWDGASFSQPGSVALEVVGPEGRTALAAANRFAGWLTR
jgi:hypothetical protein